MSCRETFLSKPVQDFDERRERAAIRIQAQARGNATRKFVKQREHGADEGKQLRVSPMTGCFFALQ